MTRAPNDTGARGTRCARASDQNCPRFHRYGSGEVTHLRLLTEPLRNVGVSGGVRNDRTVAMTITPHSGAVTAAGTRRPRARDSGMRVNSPTIAITTTMTTTPGSPKLWLATTSAAAMFRCAVPRPRTDRVSLAGPPSAQPQAK